MENNILKAIIEIFADVADLEPKKVTEESTLMEDLGLNSMEIMNAVRKIEKMYQIRIPEKDLRYFVTISDVIKYIAVKY